MPAAVGPATSRCADAILRPMNELLEPRTESNSAEARDFERPAFEVIPLDCEITAYAPDGGDPLF